MKRNALIESAALVVAVAAGAGVATGGIVLARGETRGAPGITKGFARIGRLVGGSLMTGVAITGAGAALTGLAVYSSLTAAAR